MNDGKITLQIVGWADIFGDTMVVSGDAQKAYDEYVGAIDPDDFKVAYDAAGQPYDPITEISIITLIDEHRK